MKVYIVSTIEPSGITQIECIDSIWSTEERATTRETELLKEYEYVNVERWEVDVFPQD